jgi:estrogen-related receptor beta like 1
LPFKCNLQRYTEEPDVDDDALEGGGAGMGGGADGEGLHAGGDEIRDDAVGDDEDSDEEEAYMLGGGGGGAAGRAGSGMKTAEEIEDTKAIESAVDAAEWKLELERVAPQLRVVSAADAKDWRTHLEAAHKHQEEIARTFPEVKVLLDHVAADVAQMMEKIDTRERYVNNQLEPLSAEYQHHRENLNGSQQRYNKSTEAVADLTNELARWGAARWNHFDP